MVDKNILQTLSRAEWEGIIYQRIFSERDRWLVARHLLDGVPYDRLTAEYQARYADAPLEYDQIRRRYKAAERTLIKYAPDGGFFIFWGLDICPMLWYFNSAIRQRVWIETSTIRFSNRRKRCAAVHLFTFPCYSTQPQRFIQLLGQNIRYI